MLPVRTRLRLARTMLAVDLGEEPEVLDDLVREALAAGVGVLALDGPGLGAAEVEVATDRVQQQAAGSALVMLIDRPRVADQLRMEGLIGSRDPWSGFSGESHWQLTGRLIDSRAELDQVINDHRTDCALVSRLPMVPEAGLAGLVEQARVAAAATPGAPVLFEVIDPGLRVPAEVRRAAFQLRADQYHKAGELIGSIDDQLRHAWRRDPAMEAFTLKAFRTQD